MNDPSLVTSKEKVRALLFDEVFVDSRAQDYMDAARRLWTEQYQLTARIKELEGSAHEPPAAPVAVFLCVHCDKENRVRVSAQPPGVDPVAWSTGIYWSDHQSETIRKLTRNRQPENGFTVPLYSGSPPGLPPIERYERGLSLLYRDHPEMIATVCDDLIDRSGALLGRVRKMASTPLTKEPDDCCECGLPAPAPAFACAGCGRLGVTNEPEPQICKCTIGRATDKREMRCLRCGLPLTKRSDDAI